jgi:hypothetical protein
MPSPIVASRWTRRGALVAFAALATGAGACAAPPGDDAADGAGEAFTVTRGDRFVVSASGREVVIRKRVSGVAFPFDADGLRGKTLVVHPVANRGEGGVVARAVAVTDEGDRFVVKTTPLTLAEIERVAEDEVVRVYVSARKIATPDRDVRLQGISDLLAPGRIAPQALSGFAFDGLDLASGADLGSPQRVQAGVTFAHKVTKSLFAPEAFVTWSSDEGLELGFRGSLDWQSTLTLGGKVSGELFRSRTVETPPLYVTVPVGFVPVPVALTATATVLCQASIAGPMEVSVTLDATVKLGGSVRVHPTTDSSPSTWVTRGRWAPEADGSANVTLGAAPDLGAQVSCNLPRIELKASVGGLAGPYLALGPSLSMGADGVALEGKVAAGVGAGMLGLGTGVEVNLYTWTPSLGR